MDRLAAPTSKGQYGRLIQPRKRECGKVTMVLVDRKKIVPRIFYAVPLERLAFRPFVGICLVIFTFVARLGGI